MLWLDVLPVVSAIVTIAGLSFKAGKILQKLDNVIEDVVELKQEAKEIKAELKELDSRMTVIELERKIH